MKITVPRFLPAILLATSLTISGPAQADINQGFAALQAGQFDDARAVFTAEAESGNVIGEFMLGVMAEQGFGQAKDAAQAASWYKSAADKGMASAAFNLARFYEHGNGIAKDVGKAHDYLLQAAENGHGKAMHNLGRLYQQDALGEPDLAESLKWYSAAATHLSNADRAVAITSIDDLHKLMTAEQIQDGDARYEAWIAEHPPKN
ncbi:tetratricopeptide repeat protein [Hwanghaeella grinnelliae]|uniref:tetratricopeptide repeat protein n=1 Tax=Hwanghaeella grinnelliae TaxID=2500179 RepID=UPI001386EE51|nr:tetratricopeptide repeat protein [Hwanghaeella grinnelliae]